MHELTAYQKEDLENLLRRIEPVAQLAMANFPGTKTGVVVRTEGSDPMGECTVSPSDLLRLVDIGRAALADAGERED